MCESLNDLLHGLHTLDWSHIVTGDVAFFATLDGAGIPPVTITVVDNLQSVTCEGEDQTGRKIMAERGEKTWKTVRGRRDDDK